VFHPSVFRQRRPPCLPVRTPYSIYRRNRNRGRTDQAGNPRGVPSLEIKVQNMYYFRLQAAQL